MTVSGATNSLNNITSSYVAADTESEKTDDILGRNDFLTLLVAQLENQDPLNPMEGTDFSAQLAEFSQLEQLFNLNEGITALQTALEEGSEADLTSYIGKEIVGEIDSMSIAYGGVSDGFYTLPDGGEVRVEIYDSEGSVVKVLYPGQQDAGSHTIEWDGTDSSGEQLDDGTYKYSVAVDTGYGFETISTTITGEVEGIVYYGDQPLLVVDGVWVNPDSLIQMKAVSEGESISIIDYLGKDVTSSSPLVQVNDGQVAGGDLSFELQKSGNVIIKIFNSSNALVRDIGISEDVVNQGLNSYEWDGLDNDEEMVADGIYSYIIATPEETARIGITDNVSGIKTVSGSQFLVLDSSGRLAQVSSITDVN
jgi:flagellar hook assembly protein FlgD